MGIELVSFKPGKDEEFERDILHFGSRLYEADETKNWSVMIARVDSRRWIDLYDVARHSSMEATCEDWPGCDAYSIGWDLPTPTGWMHATQPMRKQLVPRLELDRFDDRIAKRAVGHDLVTFIQDPLLTWNATARRMPDYCLHVLTHETLHEISDWTDTDLVIDGVGPNEDENTVKTLAAFIQNLGGPDELKRRYLL